MKRKLRPQVTRSRVLAPLKRLGLAALLAIGAVAVLGPQGQAQVGSPTTSLPFARGYLVTGDFAIGSVDVTAPSVDGFATGTIPIQGVPLDAVIVAAYLYWETISLVADPSQAAGVMFRGQPVDVDNVKAVKKTTQPLEGQTASCWTSGSPVAITMFRADVLRYLPLKRDKDGKSTGRRLANTADLPAGDPGHVVKLPKFGTGNTTPESAGATLLLVYQDLNPDRTANPLRTISIYDGLYIQLPDQPMNQVIRGIYESATPASARYAVVAASGQKNSNEQIYFNGTKIAGAPNLPEPFPDASTASARGWGAFTANVSQLMPGQSTADYGEIATTSVDHTNSRPFECLTWGVVAFSAAIPDSDGDGIPDAIEKATPGSPLKDGRGALLPDVAAMDAKWDHKDIFVEVNAHQTTSNKTYGSQEFPFDGSATPPISSVTLGPHSHLPTPDVLKKVGDAFANAPVMNPDQTTGIRVHFDVGDVAAYKALPSMPHGVPGTDDYWVDTYNSNEADAYIIGAAGPHVGLPTAQPRGGEVIDEIACVPSATVKCQFPAFPGTIGWKYRLQRLRDAPVDDFGGQITADEIDDWKAGAAAPFETYRRRFDRVRKGFFRYLLYAHARGKPKSPLPCRDLQGKPVDYSSPGVCSAPNTENPDFRVPSSASGIADLPGYNAMVTLGLWPELAKPYVRASTTFHELGHLFDIWHGGARPQWGNATTATVLEPNCKPNYLSSTNYMYQVHGLFRDDNPDPQLDYSRGIFGAANGAPLTETALVDLPWGLASTTAEAPLYRMAWYAPFTEAGAAATRFCSGARFPDPVPEGWPMMGRFQALGTSSLISWGTAPLQDINFDGCTGPTCLPAPAFQLQAPLSGHNDWENLLLDQMAGGRRLARFVDGEGDADFGGGDADFGAGDADFGGGDADFGGGDADFGGGDADFGGGDADFGGGDADFGGGDADFGGGDADFGGGDADFGGGGELDLIAARAYGRTAPYAVAGCVLGGTCAGPQPAPSDPTYHSIRISWKSPLLGRVSAFRVYRFYGDVITPQAIATAPQISPDLPGSQLSYTDTEELPDGHRFTYFLKAVYDDDPANNVSGPSHPIVVTAKNDPPVAVANSYTLGAGAQILTIQAPGVLGNDTDVDTTNSSLFRALLVTSTANGTLALSANGSFVYTPNIGFSGTDTFTYKANNGTWTMGNISVPMNSVDSNTATVTILVAKKPKK